MPNKISVAIIQILSLMVNSGGCKQIGESIQQKNDLQFVIYNTPYLPAIRKKYTKFRDFYRVGENWTRDNWNLLQFPEIIFLSTVASFANATLVSPAELPSSGNHQVYPEIQMQSSAEFWGEMKIYKNDSYNLTQKIPPGVYLILIDIEDINFVYCDVSKKEKNSAWEFRILLDPFDTPTWGLLTTSFLFVIPLSGKVTKIIMPMIAATLSVGIKAPIWKPKIFLVWVAASMFLSNFYSGEITSKVMVPPKDEVMTHFRHLEEHNYTLIFPDYLRDSMPSFKSHYARSVSANAKILIRLVQKAIIVSENNIYFSLACDKRKLVIVALWPAAQSIRWRHEMRIPCPNQVWSTRARKCHIGQELVQLGEGFLIFFPPSNKKLVEGTVRLIESGIHERWIQEKQGLVHSRRVQDRVRVKSPTKILETRNIQPQSLEGKMLTMIFLWGVCSFISLVTFCLEVLPLKFISECFCK